MEDRVRRPPTYLPLTPKIFDRAYLEQIWIFEQEHYSNLHLKGGPAASHTALMIAEACKKTDVAKLLRGMLVLPKDGEKKEARRRRRRRVARTETYRHIIKKCNATRSCHYCT